MKSLLLRLLAACFLAPALHAQILKDPADGRAGGGVGIAAMDLAVFGIRSDRLEAQYHAYLATPAFDTAEEMEYRSIMNRIADLLHPVNHREENLVQALSLLPHAASFAQDGGQSDFMFNTVHRVLIAKRRSEDIKALSLALGRREQVLARRADFLIRNAPLDAGQRRRLDAPVLACRQAAARIARNERLGLRIVETAAKSEFDTYLGILFLQRRYDHVLIGCELHRHLFGGHKNTRLDFDCDSDPGRLIARIPGGSTIAGLEAAALCAIAEVERKLKSFDDQIGKNELEEASNNLRKAYALGEYLHAVRVVPDAKKKRLIHYHRARIREAYRIQEKE